MGLYSFFQVILFLEGNDKCERGLGNILTPVEKVGLVLSFWRFDDFYSGALDFA